jgi:hypothetical protein
MRAVRAALVVLPLLGASAGIAAAQAPEPEGAGGAAEITDLVNVLLGSLMEQEKVTAEELQEQVAEAGGIRFRRDVPIAFMTHEALVDYLEEVVYSEYPPALAEADERLLQAFDLLPRGTDLRAVRARVLEENVVGFYDERPGRQQLYAISEDQAFTPMNQIVLAHELRHALQDQYESLHWQIPEDVGDFDDRRIAWMCLLEGDATLVMERFLLGRLGGLGAALPGGLGGAGAPDLPLAGLASLSGVPPVVRDQLVMPYLVGCELARAIEARDGPDGMRDAWHRPPASTEQVLHPEKFFVPEPPRSVRPRPGPPGGRLMSEGVLGELLLRTLLEERGDAPGAAGWGGDGWRLWDLGGRTALAWTSAWDTVSDAIEFEEALQRRFARRGSAESSEGGWALFEGQAGWRFALRREVDAVEMVSSDDPGVLELMTR